MVAAQKKWLQLFFDILGYEFKEGPLLSEEADVLVDRYPILGRLIILIVGFYLTLHLANLIDPRYDILSQLSTFWGKKQR